MMMRMLEAGGIPVLADGLREADDDNPRGYYEFERVKSMERGDTAWVRDARGKAVKVISALLPHLPGDETYRVVFMQREMSEILASQRRMLENRGEPTQGLADDQMAAMFRRHVAETREWMGRQAHMDTLFVDYNDTLRDPGPWAERLNEFLGGNLAVDAMRQVVEPALHRQRAR